MYDVIQNAGIYMISNVIINSTIDIFFWFIARDKADSNGAKRTR